MKKLFFFAALAFGLASCQNDTNVFGVDVTPEEEAVEFAISVGVPELDETRTLVDMGYSLSGEGAIKNGVIASDDYTLRYILEVYDQNDRRSDEILYAYTDANDVTFRPRLIPNRKYTFVVWVDIVSQAAAPSSSAQTTTKVADVHYNTADLRAVTINEATWAPMDETRDAFTGFTEVDELTASTPISVTCTRPFGKLRVITTDIEVVTDLAVSPAYAKVEYTGIPTYTFDAFNGNYTANATTLAKQHAKFNIANYASNTTANVALYTDYFFAPVEQVSLGAFTMTVYDTNDDATLITTTTFPTDIPVKRNTLTTVTGNFLTIQNVDLNVIVSNEGSFTGAIDRNIAD